MRSWGVAVMARRSTSARMVVAALLAMGVASCADGPSPEVPQSSAAQSPTPAVAPGVSTKVIEGRPIGVAVVAGKPWVALSGSGSVATPTSTVAVGPIPLRLAAARDGVWVTVFGGGSLARIDTDSRVAQRIDLQEGAEPEGVVVDGDRLWVVDQAEGALLALNSGTGRRTHQVEVGYGPRLAALGPKDVWVTTYGTGGVTAVARKNATIRVSRTEVCRGVQGIAQAGTTVWVVCTNDNVVLGLDVQSLTEVARFPLRSADAVTTDGSRIVAVGQVGPTALVIDSANRRLEQTLLLGNAQIVSDGNVDAALDQGRLFVTHPDTETLYQVTLPPLEPD